MGSLYEIQGNNSDDNDRSIVKRTALNGVHCFLVDFLFPQMSQREWLSKQSVQSST